MPSVTDLFLDFVSFDTQSDATSTTFPSTPGQKVLGAHLAEVMRQMGIQDARCDEFGYVYGSLPPTSTIRARGGLLATWTRRGDFWQRRAGPHPAL